MTPSSLFPLLNNNAPILRQAPLETLLQTAPSKRRLCLYLLVNPKVYGIALPLLTAVYSMRISSNEALEGTTSLGDIGWKHLHFNHAVSCRGLSRELFIKRGKYLDLSDLFI